MISPLTPRVTYLSIFRKYDIKLSQPFGSQKIFFDLIWKRLHPELHKDLTSTPAPGDMQSSLELITEEYPSPPSELIQVPQESSADAKIPRIQAEKKPSALYSDTNCPSQECLIPKKRYCVQKRLETSTISADKYPELSPLTNTEYNQTDMSAAMILATGFSNESSKTYSPQIEEV